MPVCIAEILNLGLILYRPCLQEGRVDWPSSADCEGPLSDADCPTPSGVTEGRRRRGAIFPGPRPRVWQPVRWLANELAEGFFLQHARRYDFEVSRVFRRLALLGN